MSGPNDDELAYPIMASPRLRLLIPLTVAFAFLMEQLDFTIITTAISDMARELQVTPLAMNLAITSYILSRAVFIPVSSWFADRLGTRLVFAGALALFTVGSALYGLSSSLPVLVMMRVVQGLAGIALVLRFIADGRSSEPPRFDLPGFLLCGAGLALLQFALENVGRPMLPLGGVALLFAGGGGCLALFTWHALRTTDAALDLRLFSIRTLRGSAPWPGN